LKWQGYPSGWTFRFTKKTPERFAAWIRSLTPEIEAVLDPELATLRDAPVSGRVSLDVDEAGIDWFDLKVVLDVSDSTLTPEELKLLLNARGGYVRLDKKGWRRLEFNLSPEEDEQLARIGLNPRDFSAEPQRFHALQLADEAASRFLAPEHVAKIQRSVGELKTRVMPPLPSAIRAEMRPYQIEGFHFLAYLTANRFGGVLADDMGLGKTLQTLAWLAWLRGMSPAPRPASLVVCPKSVMDNWRAEAERFYPGLRVRLWRGESSEELATAHQGSDLVIINYAQ
jgi:SNF2 family DNA or RNA helicase